MARAILAGERGVRTDLALINAGAAIYAAGVAQTLERFPHGNLLAARKIGDLHQGGP